MTEVVNQQQGGDLVGTDRDRGVHRAGDLSRYSTSERDQLRALAGLDEASDADLDMLAAVAARTGLDPFLKEVYLVGRKTKTGGYRGEPERWETKWTVQAGIDGFRKVLFRTAEVKGKSHEIGAPVFLDSEGNERRVWLKDWGYPAAALVEVRLGDSVGHGIATWDEFVQTKRDGNPNSMWEKMGPTMLAKCAEAQAHRKVNSLTSGMYVNEEMGQASNRVTAEARRMDQPQPVERGATGLRAALERKPAQESELSATAIAALAELEALTARGEIPTLLDTYKPDLGEAEYQAVHQRGVERWNELGDQDADVAEGVSVDDEADA